MKRTITKSCYVGPLPSWLGASSGCRQRRFGAGQAGGGVKLCSAGHAGVVLQRVVASDIVTTHSKQTIMLRNVSNGLELENIP